MMAVNPFGRAAHVLSDCSRGCAVWVPRCTTIAGKWHCQAGG